MKIDLKKINYKSIFSVLYWVVMIIVTLVALLVIYSNTNLNSEYGLYVVSSGSMEPAIHTGSVIFTRSTDEYDVDDIVTVQSGTELDGTYTHRIYEVSESEDGVEYFTKGDANDSADIEPIVKSDILGEVQFSVPLVGYAVSFTKTPTGFILLIVAPAILIIANELGNIKKEVTKLLDKKKKSAPKPRRVQGSPKLGKNSSSTSRFARTSPKLKKLKSSSSTQGRTK